ncbi:hypothetical protein ACGF0J_22395 [Nonomuraea sp. NPDC047897]
MNAIFQSILNGSRLLFLGAGQPLGEEIPNEADTEEEATPDPQREGTPCT